MKKRISLFAVLLFASISFAMAQGFPQMDPQERAKTTVERLKPELTLTDQQEKDITPIYAEYYSGFQKLFESGAPSPEGRQKLTSERDEKLKKILSEDQMKKLAEAEEKMRQQRRQQAGGN